MLLVTFPRLFHCSKLLLAKPHQKYLSGIKHSVNLSAKLGVIVRFCARECLLMNVVREIDVCSDSDNSDSSDGPLMYD